MGFVTSILGGRPGMITGATGALAVVFIHLPQYYGAEYILSTQLLRSML